MMGTADGRHLAIDEYGHNPRHPDFQDEKRRAKEHETFEVSKREWANTCDRSQTRLDNLKIENLDIMGTGMRKKPGVGKQGSINLPNRTN